MIAHLIDAYGSPASTNPRVSKQYQKVVRKLNEQERNFLEQKQSDVACKNSIHVKSKHTEQSDLSPDSHWRAQVPGEKLKYLTRVRHSIPECVSTSLLGNEPESTTPQKSVSPIFKYRKINLRYQNNRKAVELDSIENCETLQGWEKRE